MSRRCPTATTLFFAPAAELPSTYGTPATVHYADGSTTQGQLSGIDWYTGGGAITASFRYTPGGGTDSHPVSIGSSTLWIDPTRDAVGITLPTTAQPAPNVSSLHVFALTLQPAGSGRSILLRDGHSTTSTLTDGGPQSRLFNQRVTMSFLVGASKATSSRCSRPGTRYLLSALPRSCTSALKWPELMFIPACADFMSRPV